MLNKILHQCFRKIKVKETYTTDIDRLFIKQKELKKKTDKDSQIRLKEVEATLAEKTADDLFKIVKEEVEKVKCQEGGFNSGHLWNIKNKQRPKVKNVPTAMVDKDGNLVTSPEGIKQEAMKHFKEVLKNRPIKTNLKEYQEERESLCKERIKAAGTNVTQDWDVKDVSYVIKHLKKKKSRDPHGYPNELIQCGGKDVTFAITKLMNGIKKEQIFPHCLQACNITSL